MRERENSECFNSKGIKVFKKILDKDQLDIFYSNILNFYKTTQSIV